MRAYTEIGVALVRLVLNNLDLAYYFLPRRWRGGYRSPWRMKMEGS